MHSIALTDHAGWSPPGQDQVRALIDDALKLLDRDRHAARAYLGQAHRIIDRELEVAAEPASPRAKGARLTGWRVRRLAEFVEANIERTIQVGELARVIRIIDGPIAMLPCVSLYFYERCRNCDERRCGLHDTMTQVRDLALKVLERKTVADIATL